MAVLREVVSDVDQIAPGGFLVIKPSGSATREWVIHNIWRKADIRVMLYKDATDFIGIAFTGEQLMAYYSFHLTATVWLHVYNDDVAEQPIGYDGVVTRI